MAVPALRRGLGAPHETSFTSATRRSLWLHLLAAAIAAELSLAVLATFKSLAEPARPNHFATASALLCLAALWQARAASIIFMRGANCNALPPRVCLRLLAVTASAGYGIGLAIGPAAGVALVSAGCFAVLGSLTLLPLTATPQTLDQWRKLLQGQRPRRIGLAVYHALVALAVAEASLRGVRFLEHFELFAAAISNEAVRATEHSPNTVTARPGVLRVAIVEGLTANGPHGASSCAAELAQPAAGLEICRLSMTADAADARPTDWRAELAAFRPDVVLGMVALEQGLKSAEAGRDPFDWRSLETLRLLAGLLAAPQGADRGAHTAPLPAAAAMDAGDVRRLSICRTPLDDTVKVQWSATFVQLDRLIEACAPVDARLALVIVPDGFQVNRVLCDTLRRRAGFRDSQLDLELPQRRLAAYAHERGLMMVDLLPHLRASRSPVYQQAAGGWNDEARLVANRTVGGWLHSQYGGLAATAQLSRGR